MKYVVNIGFGNLMIPEELCKELGCKPFPSSRADIRKDPRLVKWVQEHSSHDMALVDIPDNATDWKILDDSGFIYAVAVVAGKLVFLKPEKN